MVGTGILPPQGALTGASGRSERRRSKLRESLYITPEGQRVLVEELERLWKVERPRVTQEVSVAAAHGDRSENAEYIYGKKRLREIDARMRFLSKRLDALTVVRTSPERRDQVFFGAWVDLEDETGRRLTVRIVGPDESDAASGRISIDSPVARALLRRVIDDEVAVDRPKGPVVYTILHIRYEAFDAAEPEPPSPDSG